MIDALVGTDFAHMHQAFNAVCELDKCAELRQPSHRPFDPRTDGKLLRNPTPRIAQRLLQAKRDTPLFRFNAENHSVYAVAGFHNIARMPYLLAPRHLRNVNQPFDARLDLYEGAEVGQTRHRAGYALI